MYKNDLLNDLKNRDGYAAKYLTAAAMDSTESLLIALRDVSQAKIGMTGLASAAGVNRVNLYHMLSEKGNPGIRNIRAILKALKLDIVVVDSESVDNPPVATPTKRAPKSRSTTSRRSLQSIKLLSAK